MVFGQKYLGARRWIKMPGGNHFQPSEWVKLILILAVAKYFADMRQRELSWPDFMKAGAIVGIPMLMVLAQPDLGHGSHLCSHCRHGCISGWLAVEAGTGRGVVGHRGSRGGLSRSQGSRSEVLPEAASNQLYRPRTRTLRVRGTKLSNPRLRSVPGAFGAVKARKHTGLSSPFPKRTSFSRPFPKNMDS